MANFVPDKMKPNLFKGLFDFSTDTINMALLTSIAAAGYAHNVAWNEEGRLYTWGKGRAGRLGHGGEEDELVPRLVEGLSGVKIVGVTAGDERTVAWCESGKLYAFGSSRCGQLGCIKVPEEASEDDDDVDDDDEVQLVPQVPRVVLIN